MAITLSLSILKGFVFSVVMLGVGAVIGVAIAYPIFRRTGRTW